VLATLSALCVKAYPEFERVPPAKLQLINDIGECYVNTVLDLCQLSDEDGNKEATPVTESLSYQDLAETLYAKPEGEDSPHPGRVCTDITQQPE